MEKEYYEWHLPFNKENPLEVMLSYIWWGVLILMIITPITVVFFDDFGIPVSEAMRTLGFWNVLIGGGLFLGRGSVVVIDYLKREYKKEIGAFNK